MSAEEISLQVVEILNAHHVPYMLVGSLSANFHSTIRSTKDADIVIQSELEATARLIERECPILRLDPQSGFENVTATKRMLLHANRQDFVVELFGLKKEDPHDQQRFARRILVDWLGRPTWIASAEDILITKLRWALNAGRQKDVVDARNLIAVQNQALDWAYVEYWCDQHHSRELLKKIREELRGK